MVERAIITNKKECETYKETTTDTKLVISRKFYPHWLYNQKGSLECPEQLFKNIFFLYF